ncbi:MAG: SIR2 family protein [Myxococcales bacterium]|nr:SIR2 family protein [Myxococcales bacterium]
MSLPVEVIEGIKAGKVILFVGSRFAMEAAEEANLAYPEARDLAKELGWKKPKIAIGAKARPATPSVEEGCALYEQANGRSALVEKLKQLTDPKCGPSAAHKTAAERFPLVFTTCGDELLEAAARENGVPLDVLERGDKIPDPDPARRTLVRLRGSYSRPESLLLTPSDFQSRQLGPEARKQLRTLIRNNVVFFVGYRVDEEEFERLFTELSDAYGGELPRCHLACAQGPIDDYLWQKWVWRGLLLFLSDPGEAMKELGVRP